MVSGFFVLKVTWPEGPGLIDLVSFFSARSLSGTKCQMFDSQLQSAMGVSLAEWWMTMAETKRKTNCGN